MATIPLEAMTNDNGDKWRRDQYGRYLIVPPSGGIPIGYSRVTTIAKTLDTGGALAPWKATMCAAGLIMRRGLRAQWEALIAGNNGDPWYASEQSKQDCKALVEDCAAVGGANDRREMGTSLHTLTALLDVGRTPTYLTPETEADLKAYMAGLAAADVQVCPGQVELTVVLDDYQVAGTFDRLVTIPGFDRPLIADLKTGADLDYAWQSIAVQMAAYSRGNAIYEQGPNKDGSLDQRHPMPVVDQNHGLIIWLNAGTATLELFLVDLDAGWVAFSQSMWVRGWRKQTVSMRLADRPPIKVPADGDLTEVLAASIAAVEAGKATRGGTHRAKATATPPSDDVIVVYQVAYRNWLQNRINAVGAVPAARTDLARSWPREVPSLRDSTQHTTQQFAVIEQLLTDIEGRHSIPFGEPRPTHPDPVGLVIEMFPGSSTTTSNTSNSKEPAS